MTFTKWHLDDLDAALLLFRLELGLRTASHIYDWPAKSTAPAFAPEA
jgi:hypothetical protein